MDMSKYMGMYLTETREHLQAMGNLLLALEKDPSDRQGIDSLFREAHSVKGMAASMGFEATAGVAHSLEDFLDHYRSSGAVPQEGVDRLFEGVDLLSSLLEDVEAGRSERGVDLFLTSLHAAEPSPEPSPAAEIPRSSTAQVQDLSIALAAETVAPAARALLILGELDRLGKVLSSEPSKESLERGLKTRTLTVRLESERSAEELAAHLKRFPDVAQLRLPRRQSLEPESPSRPEEVQTVRVPTRLLDQLINLTGEMVTSRYVLQSAVEERNWNSLRQGLNLQSRLIGDLHHQILQARMMPLEHITGRLPRVVRDLARRTGKEIELRIEGEDVELDRTILEGLSDPLVHLVRNAVDHGIAQKGIVSVSASREKDLVKLQIQDNGCGIDPARIRCTAIARGLISAEHADRMGEQEVLQLICTPGFSTAEAVTETSGRGVGMDVVKSAVDRLGGSLEILSAPGEGTCVRLCMPLSIAIIHLLMVEIGGELMAFPFTRVVRTLEVPQGALRQQGRQATVCVEKEEIPLLSLHKVLNLPHRRSGPLLPIVISELRGRRVGLVVDRLAGQRQAFVKGLSFPLDRLPGISGATVLGDGRVIFVVDPHSLLDARPGRPHSSGGSGTQP